MKLLYSLIPICLLVPGIVFGQAQNVTHRGDSVADGDEQEVVKHAVIATDGADSDSIVSPAAAKRVKVLGYGVWCSAATDITFEEETSGTDFTGTINLVANGNLHAVAPVNPIGYFETAVAGKDLMLLKSDAVDCDGHITYIEID